MARVGFSTVEDPKSSLKRSQTTTKCSRLFCFWIPGNLQKFVIDFIGSLIGGDSQSIVKLFLIFCKSRPGFTRKPVSPNVRSWHQRFKHHQHSTRRPQRERDEVQNFSSHDPEADGWAQLVAQQKPAEVRPSPGQGGRWRQPLIRFTRQSFEETVEAAKKKRVGGIEAALAAVGRCRNHRQPSRQPSGFRIRIGNFLK